MTAVLLLRLRDSDVVAFYAQQPSRLLAVCYWSATGPLSERMVSRDHRLQSDARSIAIFHRGIFRLDTDMIC